MASVKIFVPTVTNSYLEHRAYQPVAETERFLTSLFGGCITTQGHGMWRDGAGRLVTDGISIVESYASDLDIQVERPAIEKFCELLKKMLRQTTIAYAIQPGEICFI